MSLFLGVVVLKIYTFHVKQILSISLEKAREFFSDPANFATLTPPSVHMSMEKASSSTLYREMQISYRMSQLFDIALNWTAEIAGEIKGLSFIVQQLKGRAEPFID
jgi:ligand-binding SRPBCC domain-containing protein